MTSQRDRFVKLKKKKSSLFITIQKSALPPHCSRNYFSIILPSMPVWPFFCFIHILLR